MLRANSYSWSYGQPRAYSITYRDFYPSRVIHMLVLNLLLIFVGKLSTVSFVFCVFLHYRGKYFCLVSVVFAVAYFSPSDWNNVFV